MAEEFRADGIAFNALWPRTTIATSAIRYALGGDAMMAKSRSPEIMADAAHAIFSRPSRACTGNFFIDDTLLYEEGVRDFDHYRMDPKEPLLPDFFVPESSVPPPGISLAPLK
jgi:citronellol/citronellal dehydrogenase